MTDAYRCPDCGGITIEFVDHFDECVVNAIAEDPTEDPSGCYPACPMCPPPTECEPVNVAWTPRDVVTSHRRREDEAARRRAREPLPARHQW